MSPNHLASTTPRSPHSLARALLIDADDTLWEGSIYYHRCTERYAEALARYAISSDEAVKDLRRAELEAVPTHGYGALGYTAGLEASCRRLLALRGIAVRADLLAAVRGIGQPLLDPPMVLLDGVRDTLILLRATSWLALVTKGSPQAQTRKIEHSSLGPLFDEIYIEPEKDAATYRRIVAANELDPLRTWMVGNAPRSDINAANLAGIAAIHVPHPATWAGEMEPIIFPERVVTLPSFVDLASHFGLAASQPAESAPRP